MRGLGGRHAQGIGAHMGGGHGTGTVEGVSPSRVGINKCSRSRIRGTGRVSLGACIVNQTCRRGEPQTHGGGCDRKVSHVDIPQFKIGILCRDLDPIGAGAHRRIGGRTIGGAPSSLIDGLHPTPRHSVALRVAVIHQRSRSGEPGVRLQIDRDQHPLGVEDIRNHELTGQMIPGHVRGVVRDVESHRGTPISAVKSHLPGGQGVRFVTLAPAELVKIGAVATESCPGRIPTVVQGEILAPCQGKSVGRNRVQPHSELASGHLSHHPEPAVGQIEETPPIPKQRIIRVDRDELIAPIQCWVDQIKLSP